MSHQTPLNGNGRSSPTAGVRHGLSGLLHDVTTLAELQAELLKLDAQDAARRAVLPAALIGAAVVFALSTVPLLLLVVAQLLRDQAEWPAALATFVALLIGLLIAGVCGWLGFRGVRRMLEPLDRSRDELSRNIAWLKTALQRQENQEQVAAQGGIPWPNTPR